jgi:uncharacterized protein
MMFVHENTGSTRTGPRDAPPSASFSRKARRRTFLLFFTIVLFVYGAINTWLYAHARHLTGGAGEPWFTIAFIALVLSFILGRVFERIRISAVSTVLVWTGSIWLGLMAYFVIAAAAADIVNLLIAILPGVPPIDPAISRTLGWLAVGVSFALIAAGFFNALHIRVRTFDLSIPKKAGSLEEFRVAMASDIHCGTIISHRRLSSIVSRLNALEPDIILLPGDVIDEDLLPVVHRNLGDILRTLRARYGVFAITGNHEFIGGADAGCRYLEEHGITVLRDRSVVVGGGVVIAGREDRSIRQFDGRNRKSVSELLHGIDRSLPVILMDHQPFHLGEAVEHNIDLQLSGHTHHGQMWPFNYITRRIYEVSWGYLKKGATHIYVSCGAGTWGPPVRIGNTPEVIEFNIRFIPPVPERETA